MLIPHLYWIIHSYFNIHIKLSFSNHKYRFHLHLTPISSHVECQINRTQSHSIWNHLSSGAIIIQFPHSGLTFLFVQHAMSSISTQFKNHISVITIWVDATSGTDLSDVEIRSVIFHRTNCRLTYWPLGDVVVIWKPISGINMLKISCEIATTWMPQDLTDV